MYGVEQPADGSAPGAPGPGAPGLGDAQAQFAGGSIPPATGGAGTPSNPESKTTLWYVITICANIVLMANTATGWVS
jgi:hypothetical protein